jgi:hypothetical protein
VDAFVERRPAVVASSVAPFVADEPPGTARRRPVAFGLLAVGAAAAAGGTWALLSALDAQGRLETSQAGVYQANRTIDQRNDWARALYGISGAALVTGTLLLLWPRLTGAAAPPVTVGITPRGEGGTVLEWTGRF